MTLHVVRGVARAPQGSSFLETALRGNLLGDNLLGAGKAGVRMLAGEYAVCFTPLR